MSFTKVGILAMSEDSTSFYINEWYKITGRTIDSIPVFTTDFEAINNLLPAPSKSLKEILKSHLKKISNIDTLIIPNITIHETIDEIFQLEDFGFEIVHPVQLIIQRLKALNIKEVMLFGSSYTMQNGYVSNKFEQNQIAVFFPDKEDLAFIDNCRKAIYQRKSTNETIKRFNKTLKTYAIKTTVVMACTELSMAYQAVVENVFDMVRIQVDSALKN